MTDEHCQNLEARIKMVQANILRMRDGWASQELEDLFQALEFTAVQDGGLRRFARFQRVTRMLHLAHAQRRTGHLLGAESSSSSPSSSLSHGEKVALRDLDFIEQEYAKVWEKWKVEHGEDDEKSTQYWIHLQHVKFDKTKWMERLGAITKTQALDAYKIMLEEHRQKLGDTSCRTINLLRKVAKMLVELTVATGGGDGDEGATRAENLARAKTYIDIARQHAVDKEWARRKLEPVIAMYGAAVAAAAVSEDENEKEGGEEGEEEGPPKKKPKHDRV